MPKVTQQGVAELGLNPGLPDFTVGVCNHYTTLPLEKLQADKESANKEKNKAVRGHNSSERAQPEWQFFLSRAHNQGKLAWIEIFSPLRPKLIVWRAVAERIKEPKSSLVNHEQHKIQRGPSKP